MGAVLALLLLLPLGTSSAQDPNACDEPGEFPDLVAGNLDSVVHFGTVGDVTAYAIGATTCNLGSCWADWFFDTSQHPVFAQNLFRLRNGRFEQIGQSFVAHRFFALSNIYCETGCLPTNGEHLGVNCSTQNSASVTGAQQYLGPKSEIDPSTGVFPFPFSGFGVTGDAVFKRLQVHTADLDPAQNAGASYFLEGQNVAADDAAAGARDNNASYRPVSVAPASFDLLMAGATVQQQPAIHAWAASDPEVMLETVDVADDGRYFVGSRVTPLGGGLWHYEYAVHNLNSDRSARSVSIELPPGAVVSNIGFHDVDYHSGEPYDGTDWPAAVASGAGPSVLTWSTATFDDDPDANALRWGTLYNFRFDADVPPATGTLAVGLFRPGSPDSFSVSATVPRLCDGDGSCEPGENACNCAADCGSPPDAELECTDGLDGDCDGLADCVDPDCCGDASCPAADGDGDGHLACADCDDGDGAIWQTPGEVTDLVVARGVQHRAILSWSPPEEPGSTTWTYDTVRSVNPFDFVNGATCLAVADPSAATAVDAEIPAPGVVFHYLVRAENSCPIGTGPLGAGRSAIDCP